jgi:hypothetical protein
MWGVQDCAALFYYVFSLQSSCATVLLTFTKRELAHSLPAFSVNYLHHKVQLHMMIMERKNLALLSHHFP